MNDAQDQNWPQIRTAGYDGFLVSFADRLSEQANRAALAFRDAVEHAGWEAVRESSTSLVSTYLRFDPLRRSHAEMRADLEALAHAQNWFAADLPTGRRLWHVPTVFGGDHGPQMAEAASAAGLTEAEAIEELSRTQVRVQTIGFAPGMPYLGALSEAWDIPRLTKLTAEVPAAGLCVAIRQLVLFPVATPTGWRHIGQTRFRLFRPGDETPFVLRPGDEVLFYAVTPEELARYDDDPDGGATSEVIA
ncbi:allophanate hydrolase subunit 1 [Primorskyibacter aestuariivivens]|uniref:5-oxoprolinase subunit B family protein n=1 Tax=Primorskyibacter aestuariivivens TaxID=1888912 RepID=UPI002301886F|nr:allophanate hydrolase subunit 1 [Primorskyibacter aestuariivivens]MDA7430162.1 allophanate hydrolase subunit 1 [Primorskyibacter aestuariivivens]